MVKWTKFEECNELVLRVDAIDEYAKGLGISHEEAKQRLVVDLASQVVMKNSLYTVFITKIAPGLHLSIKRNDRGTVGKERFRDFQRIKNELVGPEWEAVELYPAESRLVDSANQYHLWCQPFRFHFGFRTRLVDGTSKEGAVQEPFVKE